VSDEKIIHLTTISECQIGTTCFTYLGLPLRITSTRPAME